jgi:proteasome accessory factor B
VRVQAGSKGDGREVSIATDEIGSSGFRYPRLMRRIERLINLIIALLETREPMTARQIRDEVAGYDQGSHDAFRRAFERDKEALRNMGIPVEVRERDAFGAEPEGYIIPKAQYYLPPLDLEPDELAALKIASDAILGSGEVASAGYMKLSVEGDGIPVEGPRVVWGADVAAEDPLLSPLYSAVLDRRTIRFAYRAARSEFPEDRTIDPYSLVNKRGWYVVGRDHMRDEARSFKLSRIEEPIETLEARFEPPEGFDAASHLAGEPWEIGAERALVVVRFSQAFEWWVDQNLRDAPATPVAGGGVDVQFEVGNLDALISWLLGFGGDFEIVSPPPARARLLEHLAPFIARAGRG